MNVTNMQYNIIKEKKLQLDSKTKFLALTACVIVKLLQREKSFFWNIVPMMWVVNTQQINKITSKFSFWLIGTCIKGVWGLFTSLQQKNQSHKIKEKSCNSIARLNFWLLTAEHIDIGAHMIESHCVIVKLMQREKSFVWNIVPMVWVVNTQQINKITSKCSFWLSGTCIKGVWGLLTSLQQKIQSHKIKFDFVP